MIRKQIYLTAEQDRLIALRADELGCTQSEVIRMALDLVADASARSDRGAVVREVFGVWKDRADLPDFDALRRESDDRSA
jgi:hypothetical protein